MGQGSDPAALDESRRDAALERYRVLKPFLVDGVPLSAIATDSGVAWRTLRRWVTRYREKGLSELARPVDKFISCTCLRQTSSLDTDVCSRGSSSRVFLLSAAFVVLPSSLLYSLLGGAPSTEVGHCPPLWSTQRPHVGIAPVQPVAWRKERFLRAHHEPSSPAHSAHVPE